MVNKFEYEPTLIDEFIDAPGQPRAKEMIAAALTLKAAFDDVRYLRRYPPSHPEGTAPGAILTPEQASRFADQSIKVLRAELAARVAEGRLRAARTKFWALLSKEGDELQKERAALQRERAELPQRRPMEQVSEYSCSSTCSHTVIEHERGLSIRELNFLRGRELLKQCQLNNWDGSNVTDSNLDVARKVVSALVREARLS